MSLSLQLTNSSSDPMPELSSEFGASVRLHLRGAWVGPVVLGPDETMAGGLPEIAQERPSGEIESQRD